MRCIATLALRIALVGIILLLVDVRQIGLLDASAASVAKVEGQGQHESDYIVIRDW